MPAFSFFCIQMYFIRILVSLPVYLILLTHQKNCEYFMSANTVSQNSNVGANQTLSVCSSIILGFYTRIIKFRTVIFLSMEYGSSLYTTAQQKKSHHLLNLLKEQKANTVNPLFCSIDCNNKHAWKIDGGDTQVRTALKGEQNAYSKILCSSNE